MYCNKCGTPFNAGAQYCTSCGKPLIGAPPATAASPAPAPAVLNRSTSYGRVYRNISLLAVLWLANGIFRLLEVGGMMAFRNFFGWGWGWPVFHWNPFWWGGLFSAGIFLASFGVIHLILAWGLFERQPWARMLGIIIGLLALIRFPFGTALGIYTLWVLLPETSASEYDVMTRVSGTARAAR